MIMGPELFLRKDKEKKDSLTFSFSRFKNTKANKL